jgi:hypothetical protein
MLRAGEHRRHRHGVVRDGERRLAETSFTEPLTRQRLVTASFDGRRWVPVEAESTRGMRGKNRGPVTDRDHAIRRLRQRPGQRVKRQLEIVEPNRDRPIAPGILETIAAVGRHLQLDAKPPGRVIEGANLIAGGSCKEKDARHGQIRAACPSVGSAQQYHGSLR